MDLQLKGKVAIVTGGTKGIGKGCCEMLAGEGVNLVINYRSNPDDAEQVKKEIEETYGVEVLLAQGDASQQETVDATFDAAIEKFGKIDILINNANGAPGDRGNHKSFAELTFEAWRVSQEGVLNGPFRWCSKLVRYWIENERGGHIINVVSKSCFMTNSINNQPYASHKGALTALTRSLANEVTKYGIYVNGIIPGYVQTERGHQPGTERYERMLPKLPTGQFGKPRDMGAVATFLCSPLANQIIGAVVDCTGGTLL